MKVQFHGGASEVGRSCIGLTTRGGSRYLLDIGVKFKEDGFLLPENVLDVPKIEGVFLTHAHLDHSGGLPLFEHKDLNGPIFCTKTTFALTRIMLKDSFKIQRIRNLHPAYSKTDLREVRKDTLLVKYDKWYERKDLRFMFINAGHIPGSAMVLVEADGKRLLYTGDFNTRKNLLMKQLRLDGALTERPLDALIVESTYGDRGLPDRDELEREFLNEVSDTVKRNGSVLVPVFSIGRAQEILIMLSKRKFPCKIYLDGLCKATTRKIIETEDTYTDNYDALERAFGSVELVGSENHRKSAVKKQGIFITTSGMLQGGPVLSYLKEMWHDPRNAVLLTGFQCKRTNGDNLLQHGYVYIDGWKTMVKCKARKFDFSGHADVEGIKHLVKALNPKKVFFVHGDQAAVDSLKSWADTNVKGTSYAPHVGDIYEI